MNDLRYAVRSLARSPVLTLAAVLTLGLGIGANSAMFGVVDRLFFRPPPHVVDPDRVVRVSVTRTDPRWGTITGGSVVVKLTRTTRTGSTDRKRRHLKSSNKVISCVDLG